jgi:hypothetical protein
MATRSPSPSGFLETLKGLTPALARAAQAASAQTQDLFTPAATSAPARAGRSQAAANPSATPSTNQPSVASRLRRFGEQPSGIAPAAPTSTTPAARVTSSFHAAPAPAGAAHQPAAARPRAAIKLSDEQEAMASCYSPVMVVKAFAGTGKTTGAVALTSRRSNKPTLYMPFNRANAADARARMGKHVDCLTGHAVARRAMPTSVTQRIPEDWRAAKVRDELGLRTYRAAALAQTTLTNFLISADAELTYTHASPLEGSHRASAGELGEALTSARTLWRRMNERSDTVSIPHDAYLKMWALSKPKLPYSLVILDEYQDTNPVMAAVMRQQTHLSRVYIGDEHQSIYAFRGAINAMAELAGQGVNLALTQTWRFGPRTAEIANLLLHELKGERLQLKGMGIDAPYVAGASVAKLARTNAQLIKEAALLLGSKIHWVGGAKSYQLHKVVDAYHLHTGQRDQISDALIRGFASFQEMKDYSEETRDAETRIMATVVEEFGRDTPQLVRQIYANEVTDPSQADYHLTTAHRSKGLEFDYVELCNDFELLMEIEQNLAHDPFCRIEEQEVNLLYVALTRTKKMLQPNEETRVWLDRLPEFRRARQLARERAQRRMRP